jgi:hypothetical protein
MNVTRVARPGFLIETASPRQSAAEFIPAADLAGCMAKLRRLQVAGRPIVAIHCGGRRVSQAVLEAMTVLAARRMILGNLALSFGLNLGEAERLFGHLFVEKLEILQRLLSCGPAETAPGGPSSGLASPLGQGGRQATVWNAPMSTSSVRELPPSKYSQAGSHKTGWLAAGSAGEA